MIVCAAGHRRIGSLILLRVTALLAITAVTAGLPAAEEAIAADRPVPLIDLGTGTYHGLTGGLYLNGSNAVPSDHRDAGIRSGRSVQPLDVNGNPGATGRVVLLSIGMSNTSQEFCSQNGFPPCDPWTFMGQAASDPPVNKAGLRIVNGAKGGQDASVWTTPDARNYNRIRDELLLPLGLSEKQVQVIWLKQAHRQPGASLPSPNADAYALESNLARIIRSAKVRYPNLKLVFISSRVYGGYGRLNPEPFAYESGFSVKWLIQAQIIQMRDGKVDPGAGDLDYTTGAAPWIAWGPYLWADTIPRSDGLMWARPDFQSDGTHPSPSGERKVGEMLLQFFKTAPFTKCWFVTEGMCP